MKKILLLLLSAGALLLGGCATSIGNELKAIATALPANSFDKIKVVDNLGPVIHTATFTDGVKQTDGSISIRSIDATTTYLGWGATIEISNFRYVPSPAAAPAGLSISPAAPIVTAPASGILIAPLAVPKLAP